MVLFLQLALWDTYVQSFLEENLKKEIICKTYA